MTQPFRCNICGVSNRAQAADLGRENASCESCGSNVRTRGLIHALSLELFGTSLALPDFPRVKSIRGLGLSDSNNYAARLAEKFDYRNTFFDREPRFDVTNPAEEDFGKFDFIVSSEVFEHVPPPPDNALRNAVRLLKSAGVLVMTVPYAIDSQEREHFPELHEFGLGRLGNRLVLLNKTRDGGVQVFEDIVFHGGIGHTLEMREFSEEGLTRMLADAGFTQTRFHGEDCEAFGIVWSGAWSLPITARKGPFALSPGATRDIVEEWRDLRLKFDDEMHKLNRSYWFRLGRKLGLV